MYLQTILGSGGTIGSILARELVKYTSGIRLVGRHPEKVNKSDELFTADLSIPGMVDRAVKGSDIVYLVVGFDYNTYVWEERWPKLVRATIDSCIKHRARLVFFDNVYMYDVESIPCMTESSPMNPPSAKGMVRKTLVQMIMSAVRSGRLMALIARSADFYGPGGNNKILFNKLIFERLKKRKSPLWFITADKKHSFTFTEDAARATALLGNTDDAYNQIWHLPTHPDVLTIREISNVIANELNVRAGIYTIPEWMIKFMGFFDPVIKEMKEMLYQYDRDYFFDSSKFAERFDFNPVTYTEGIKRMISGETIIHEYAQKIPDFSAK